MSGNKINEQTPKDVEEELTLSMISMKNFAAILDLFSTWYLVSHFRANWKCVFARSLQKAKSEQKTDGQWAYADYITGLRLFVNVSSRRCKKRPKPNHREAFCANK